VPRRAQGRRDVGRSAAVRGSRGVKVNADDIKTAPPDLNSAGHIWYGWLEGSTRRAGGINRANFERA
jgi:hypothetical protein